MNTKRDTTQQSSAEKLKALLRNRKLLIMPCCFDALSALLVEQAGFPLTFMSGFAVSAAKLGLPDTGLISYGEMLEQGRNICNRVNIPVIGDADTGYGNPINVKRTVQGYAQAGFASVMIEDQIAPKRCGHTAGKEVVGRKEALLRLQAAIDAREEGSDVLILARTDARTTDGFTEALWRCQAFSDLGADIIFMEAPEDENEMRRFCKEVPGVKMANMLPQGRTPLFNADILEDMGFGIAAYPLTLLYAAAAAMQDALQILQTGTHPEAFDFERLKVIVGFDWYSREEKRYSGE